MRPAMCLLSVVVTCLVTACAGTPDPATSPSVAVSADVPATVSPSPTAAPEATQEVATSSPVASGAGAGAMAIERTIDVPGDGEVIYEHGILWVEDRQNQVLSQIDPATGTTIRSVDDVLGGFMTYRDGIVWMSSFVLDRLLRIDPDTGEVRRIDTGEGEAGTEAVVGTKRGVWVANHMLGTLVLYDHGGSVVDTVRVSPAGIQGPQSMTADDTYVWVGVPDLHELIGVRIADGKVVRHVKLQWWPSGAPCVGDGRVWVTSAGDGSTTEVDATTGRVIRTIDVGGTTGRCVFAFGSVWFPTLEPGGLVRVDPRSGTVTARVALPSAGLDIAASEGRLWVRIDGALLDVDPGDR